MAGSGYDIGASFSGSASSGASQSGAVDTGRGPNFGSVGYGPGSVFFGKPPSASALTSNPAVAIVIIIGLVIMAAVIVPALLRKGGR
jgi:hypothetical protein